MSGGIDGFIVRAMAVGGMIGLAGGVHAQEADVAVPLPPVVVEQTAAPTPAKPTKKKTAKSKAKQAQPAAAPSPAFAPESGLSGSPANRAGSLTVPDTAEAIAEIQRIPGAVTIVPDTQFRNTPANTVKDAIGWVPGVIVQQKWGPDARLSIRGSGLTRNYGNRGINAYMDGVPINTSDGLFDLFEVDPSAYRYVEVFKGANALRYGSNSLGGAINFVTPTGYDADAFGVRVDVGSFGFIKSTINGGGVSGPVDYFINLSGYREDGYRQHSRQEMVRLNANLGYRLSANAETRFYINANTWDGQLPGEVSKAAALNSPKAAHPEWLRQNQQRNIDSIRVANKTTVRLDGTTLEFGAFTHQRRVDHPIYEYVDYNVSDYGGFLRATDDRLIGGFRNRLIVGAGILDGTTDYYQHANLTGGVKGAMTTSQLWKAKNHSAYAENSFYVQPDVALIAGIQFSHAVRDQRDRLGVNSGSSTYDNWSPKVGVLWDVDPNWQVFGNISRSAEVPTFDANAFNIKAQTATTYEIGTRGRRSDFIWDVSLYRAEIDDELQCLTIVMPWFTAPCALTNADKTVHQGIEAGFGLAVLQSTFDFDDSVWLNVSYTYNDFFFDGDAVWGNNNLPGVAPHNLRAEVLYRHTSGFYAGPNVEWVGGNFYADNANTLKIDPFALLNFRVGFEQEKGWSAYVDGRNLLDKHYIATTITAGNATPNMELFNPGTGRAVYSGVQYRW
ncbi:TonB-dependent receptor family protein [Hyphomicrobium sulfonivorans]|uniref:TonB-dependent receptor family protein n=1 Tax=Hyphomicrobium sulfonivorans TaxID=121290 RepID=UPI0015711AA3|nr:TonB-dependent receptor [Hyphomicrobium sulfonivorans]NSL73296.1 TonB-dependent receptor [Hyphomicrobium sulfonivorans]